MIQVPEPKQIIFYRDARDNIPYKKWFNALRDTKGRRILFRRLRQLEQGHYGDCEPVGEGVFELRVFFGPGYRVYFAEPQPNLILVLCAGTKDTQSKDIRNAKRYWKEFKNHEA